MTDFARAATRGLVDPIVSALARLGATPNGVTVVGCAAHVGVALLLAAGHLRLGGAALALAASIDGLDGNLARRTGRTSLRGAFLDSSLDRVSEILVFLGLLAYALRHGPSWEPVLVYAAIAGSLMVSYTRARSEALGGGTKAGLFGRFERTVVLVLGLLAGWRIPALAILALGTSVTTAQRILDGARRCAVVDEQNAAT